MGLLDQVIGGVLGQMMGGGGSQRQEGGQGQGGGFPGGLGGGMSPIVQALLMLLMQKGMSGGLGDIFGGGARQPPQEGDRRERQDPRDDGDLGGFGQGGDRGPDRYDEPERRGDGGGEFGDLSGMLDGPGGRSSDRMGRHDWQDGSGDGPGGLDGLVDRFQRGGLGDVMESWIGSGQNRPVEPNRLADALGPQTVDTLASRTGLDRDTLLSQLAQALPGVIDGLTPQGRRPTPEDRRGW
ncbi:YidB family protein [Methylobacterium sp. Leaf108]|uniref:YidB family protein n=1 Tax=Methylobacterium sp. Leaf108 TaxID=1736256 RepID=UPI0006FDECC9|nr:YidB family protein [Methylobacterium sp. Leaf108]KQP61802.1 hypothetical protein ASF39_01365 [Methylobacterium sp. Leaf108]